MLSPFRFWEPSGRRRVRRQRPIAQRLPTLGPCSLPQQERVVIVLDFGDEPDRATSRQSYYGPVSAGTFTIQ